MFGNQNNSPLTSSAMDVQSGFTGSAPAAQGGPNPLLNPAIKLQRLDNLHSTGYSDLQELEIIKEQLNNTCQQLPEAVTQVINTLVWKLEAVLKEKDELIMAESSRGSLLLRNDPASSTAQSTAYETDEEILEQETWTTQESRKKKRKSNKKENAAPQPGQRGPKQKNREPKKPPPIKVESNDVKSITQLANISSGEGKFAIKTVNNSLVKVNCEEEDGYRKMVSALKEHKVPYYTYENKQTRPIRVVAKGLHHMWSEEEIYNDLLAKGYKIEHVSKQLSAKDKTPLNMFMLSFASDESVDSIYKINRILYNVVEICPLKGSKLIPQCKNCQEFGHTRNHCNKKPRCVKCGQGHLTTSCVKPKTVRATCANCKKDHPANYRGCSIAKEAQMLRNKQRKNAAQANQPAKIKNVPTQRPPVQRQVHKKNVNPASQKSWAQVAAAGTSQNPPSQTSSQDMGAMLTLILNEVQSIKSTVSTLNARVDAIEKRQKQGRKDKTSS
ncbi:hypothetical protein M8J77_020275 [Diaphorina citri]|nr:hypothetical protein M8J77_020275 [Diaphorina citri]